MTQFGSTAAELLQYFIDQNVELRVEGDSLRVRAPEGLLTDPLREGLRMHKEEIIRLIATTASEHVICEDGFFSLTVQQNEIRFLEILYGPLPAYYIPFALLLTGPLDKVALDHAFLRIQQIHPTLRTILIDDDESHAGKQQIQTQPFYPQIDLDDRRRSFPSAAKYTGMQEILRQEARHMLSYTRPWRARLFILGEEEHILFFSFHHILVDGWSLGILQRDLLALYQGLPLKEQQRKTYANFAISQQSRRALSKEQRVKYWSRYLQEASPACELPLDGLRGSQPSFNGAAVSKVISEKGRDLLKQLCHAESVTRFQCIATLWNVLANRMTGQTDIISGIPVAARDDSSYHATPGLFARTLPLRTRIERATTYRSLVQQVKSDLIEALEHSEVSLAELRHAAYQDESTSSPLFRTMVAAQAASEEKMSVNGLTLAHFRLRTDVAKFDMTLFLEESVAVEGGELRCTLEYNSDLYLSKTAQQVLDLFCYLVEVACEQPDIPVCHLPLVAVSAPFSQLKGEERVLPTQTVWDLFTDIVATKPDHTAVCFKEETLTYRELAAEIERLASGLLNRGVKRGDRICIMLPRSLEFVATVLAIVRIGAAFVPVDEEYPLERIRYMLQDSEAALIIGTPRVREKIDERDQEKLLTVSELRLSGDSDSQELPDEPFESDLAYMIYTSGSTGQPKGVMIRHAALLNYLLWARDAYEVEAGEGAIVHSTLAFDATITSFFTPLLVGKTVTLLPEEDVLQELAHALESGTNYSLIKITPAHLQALQYLVDPARLSDAVRFVIIGGEALRRDVLAFWYNAMPRTRFVNEYGPTETVVGCCVLELMKERDGVQLPARPAIPIGKPIANTVLTILDSAGNPVPPGVPGELYIGGRSVGSGYYRKVRQTAERFVPDRWSSDEGAVMYRTGDLVRLLPSGDLDFLGRMDNQVKLRGFRIELEEIECALSDISGVTQAVVILREDPPQQPRLVAYIECEEGLAPARISTLLAQKLPNFMIPSVFVKLDSIPVTAHGKVDRSRLPPPVHGSQITDQVEAVAPATAREKLLARVWCTVLGLEQIDVTASFFAVGGDSISALQIVSRIRAAGFTLSVQDIFEHVTIQALAPRLRAESFDGKRQKATGVVRDISLLPIQEWFLSQPGPYNYFNQSVLIRLKPHLTADLIERALNEAARRFAVFSQRFQRDTTGAWKATEGHEALFPLFQFSYSTDEEQREIFSRLQTSLDLGVGPLALAGLLTGPLGSKDLALVIHHMLVDTSSWHTILSALDHALAGYITEDKSSILPEELVTSSEWSDRLRQLHDEGVFNQEIPLWMGYNDIATKTLLPLEQAVPGKRIIGEYSVKIPIDHIEGLFSRARKNLRVRKDHVLIAALSRALYVILHEGSSSMIHRIPVGFFVESHGRVDELLPESSLTLGSTVGWLTSLYPLALEMTSARETAAQDLLIAVKEIVHRIPHHGVGYGLLRGQGLMQTQYADTSSALVFNFLGEVGRGVQSTSSFVSLSNLSVPDISTERSPLFGIEAIAAIEGGELQINLRYDAARFDGSLVERLGEQWQRELRALQEDLTVETQVLTPSDVFASGVTQAELRELIAKRGEIDDLYPLTSLQQGMLFHSQFTNGSNDYSEQLTLTFSQPLDITKLQSAFAEVVEDYDILRGEIYLRGADEPLLVIRRKPELVWEIIPEFCDEQRWIELCDRHRTIEIQNEESSLMRFLFAQIGEQEWGFVWTYHHLLLDGWSAARVLQRVIQSYQGENSRRTNTPSFRSFLSHLAKEARSLKDSERARSYWQRQLNRFESPTTVLLNERYRVTGNSTRQFAKAHTILNEQECASLSSFARQNELTLQTLCQAAWAITLSRYSGEEQVLFGETVSGRPATLPQADEMVGLFIETLPVPVHCYPDCTVLQFLHQVQQESVRRRDIPRLPLHEIQMLSNIAPGVPIFESLFVFENYPVDSLLDEAAEKLGIDAINVQEQTGFPLTLVFVPGQELTCRCIFDSTRYDREDIDVLLQRCKTLLQSFPFRAEVPLSHVSLLTVVEQKEALSRLSGQVIERPQNVGIHQLIERQSVKTPHRIAVQNATGVLTYDELNKRANQLARHLVDLGVEPGQMVGISINHSIDLIVGILAILKAGAAYVPIDPNYPSQRIDYIVEVTNLPFILTQNRYRSVFTGFSLVVIDDIEKQITTYVTHNLDIPVVDTDRCYVIFTSGTTGIPKGAALHHRGFINLNLSHQELLNLSEADATYLISSPSFDLTQKNFFMPLLCGGRVIAQESEYFDPHYHIQEIERSQASIINCTPSTFLPLIEACQRDSYRALRSIRYAVLGGEPLVVTPLLEWLEHPQTQARVVNSYGPTECTDVSSSFIVESPRLFGGKEVPIGYALPNVELLVLDDHQQIVPCGLIGELYIGGTGVGLGYLNDGIQTSQRFIPHPLLSERTVYRTGDRVRVGQDSSLHFLGRRDHQVKVRGYRIELQEVQSVLLLHPLVREALVIVSPCKQMLLAYVTLNKNESTKEETTKLLLSHLTDRLPRHMIPAYLEILSKFVLTPNGKIDRTTLPEPRQVEVAQQLVMPRDALEQNILAVWERTLDRSGMIGIRDNFFDLGGHSLLAVRIMGGLHQVVGRSLPISLLFEHPTVEELAQCIRTQADEDAWPTVVKLKQGADDKNLFFFGGAGGIVTYMRDLALSIESPHTIYGFEPPGLDGRADPLTTIESLVQYYLAKLKRIQPVGPYLLCGHSTGGRIAYEMAAQLKRDYQEAKVIVLDGIGPYPGSPQTRVDYQLADWVLEVVSVLEEFGSGSVKISGEQLRDMEADVLFTTVQAALEEYGFFPPGADSSRLRGFVAVYRSQVLASYYPEQITPVSLVLVRSSFSDNTKFEISDFQELQNDPGLGWSSFCSGVFQIIKVEGDHRTMMQKPYVLSLGVELSKLLMSSSF
jgi:amino acid adenylation domain-containing protein/non-ribosomal peptide synthase protein (TIGR01720 family)